MMYVRRGVNCGMYGIVLPYTSEEVGLDNTLVIIICDNSTCHLLVCCSGPLLFPRHLTFVAYFRRKFLLLVVLCLMW